MGNKQRCIQFYYCAKCCAQRHQGPITVWCHMLIKRVFWFGFLSLFVCLKCDLFHSTRKLNIFDQMTTKRLLWFKWMIWSTCCFMINQKLSNHNDSSAPNWILIRNRTLVDNITFEIRGFSAPCDRDHPILVPAISDQHQKCWLEPPLWKGHIGCIHTCNIFTCVCLQKNSAGVGTI